MDVYLFRQNRQKILNNHNMITVSKGLIPPVLAQGWENDLGTRPDMSIKVGC